MGPNPSQPSSTPNGDKGPKSKSMKTKIHCNFCGRNGHLEYKCFKKMEALEAAMKKHNIDLDSSSNSSSSNSYSHGHALYASNFFFNATSTFSSNE
jgi:hypothetical protein